MADEMTTTVSNGAAETAAETAKNTAATTNETETQGKETFSTEAIEKLIQSRVDKITADLGKKNSELQKELNNLKKDKLSAEEIRNIEIADKEKELTEKEQALLERENRLFAIKAIKEIGLDDGSQQTLELIDFVMGKDEEEITTRVKAFKSFVDRLLSAKVAQTFKENGRVPNGGNSNSGDDKQGANFAAELGKKKAETLKQSNDILKHYYGG